MHSLIPLIQLPFEMFVSNGICFLLEFKVTGIQFIGIHESLLARKTRICASLGSRMKFKNLCYPVFGRNKKHSPSIILISNYFDSFQCFHSMPN